MLFSDNIASGYSLRCIRVSTCTYMCARLTAFLTLATGWSITAHTCMHEIVGRMNHICTWCVAVAFWSRTFCFLAWKHKSKAFKDECCRFYVCVGLYQSDGCLPTNTSRVLLHLLLVPTTILCTVATLKHCARFQMACPSYPKVTITD